MHEPIRRGTSDAWYDRNDPVFVETLQHIDRLKLGPFGLARLFDIDALGQDETRSSFCVIGLPDENINNNDVHQPIGPFGPNETINNMHILDAPSSKTQELERHHDDISESSRNSNHSEVPNLANSASDSFDQFEYVESISSHMTEPICRGTSDAWYDRDDPGFVETLQHFDRLKLGPFGPSFDIDTLGQDETINNNDVLLGRGGMTNKHTGNQAFRRLVKDTKPMYNGYTTKADKTKASERVVQDIQAKGGRFLKNIRNITDSSDKWVVASPEEARKKASQALREKNK